MAVRRETVRLEVEDHFTKEMLKAVTAAEKLDKALRPLTGSAGGSSKSFDKVVRQVERLGRASRRSRPDLDEMARRLRLISTAASGLDPAAVSLESARRAIGRLTPETQQAVGQLQKLPAALDGVRSQAPKDLIPGLGIAIKTLDLFAPSVSAAVTGFADSVAASDPVGPIRAGIAALSLYDGALQTTASLQKNLTGAKGLSNALEAGGAFGATQAGIDRVRTGFIGLRADLQAMSREYKDVNRVQSVLRSGLNPVTSEAQRAKGALLKVGEYAGRVAGPTAALTLATSGLGDSVGGTVTQLGLMGAAFGPWGAAAGAMTGMAIDAAAANNAVTDSVAATMEAVESGELEAAKANLAATKKNQAEFKDKAKWDTEDVIQQVIPGGVFFNGAELKNTAEGIVGKSDIDEGDDGVKKAEKAVKDLERAQKRLAESQAQVASDNQMEIWAQQVAGSMRSLSADVQKPTTSLATLEQRMRDMGRADAQMGRNIKTALNNGASPEAIQEIIDDLGPEAGLALKQLAKGGRAAAQSLNRSFTRASHGAGVLEGALVSVGQGVSRLPYGRNIRLSADTARAVSRIEKIKAQIAGVKDKTVKVNLYANYVMRDAKISAGEAGPGVGRPEGPPPLPGTKKPKKGKGKADGGTVPKTGLPYADRHLYLLADGEEIISNRHGQADRHRSLLKAINADRLADGGTTGPRDRGRPRDAGRSSDRFDLPRTLRGLNKVLEESRRALKREKDTREELTDKMPSLREAVAGKLTSELFGETDAWSTGSSFADVMAKLDGDITSGNQLNRNIADLKKKGVSGDALATLLAEGDSSTIAGFAALSAGQLKTYQDRFGERAALASGNRGVGAAAAAAAYKAQNDAAAANVKKLEAKLDAIEKAIRAEHRQDRRSNQRGRGNAARSKKGK